MSCDAPCIPESTASEPTPRPEGPEVTVILVTFNGMTDLPEAFRSLHKQNYKNFKIVVVDNGSTDGSAEWIESHYPKTRVVRARTNLGFGTANNRGVRYARGKYVVFTNYDAVFDDNWLAAMVHRAESDESIACVSPLILHFARPDAVQTVGLGLQLAGHAFAAENGSPLSEWTNVIELASINGCAFLARRSILERLGAFDEGFQSLDARFFFSSLEDAELSLRYRQAGYRLVLEPCARMFHKYRQKPLTLLRFVYLERGRYRLLARSFSRSAVVALGPALLWAELLSWAFVLSKGPSFTMEKWNAVVWMLRGRARGVACGVSCSQSEPAIEREIVRLLRAETELRHSGLPPWLLNSAQTLINAVFIACKRHALRVLDGLT